jgi:hypothetical protein
MSFPDASGPELRDIHLPPPPGWWPPAPGWWVLAIALLAALAWAVWRWRRGRALARRQHALQRLLEQAVDAAGASAPAQAAAVNDVLRRAARRLDPASVTQSGPAWQATLARVPVAPAQLDALASLDQAMYRPDAGFDRGAALAAARAWLARLAAMPELKRGRRP